MYFSDLVFTLVAADATPLTGALPIMAANQPKIIPTDLENSLMHRTARTRLGHSVLLLKQKPPIIYFCIQNLFALSAQHLYIGLPSLGEAQTMVL